MFCAVYKNGMVREQESFDKLPHSEDITFYAQSEHSLLYTKYHILNVDGTKGVLPIKGGNLVSVIRGGSEVCPYVELKFEMPDKTVERMKVWQSDWDGHLPLSAVARIVEQINQCGCEMYFAYCKLRSENQALKSRISVLKTDCNTLGMRIMDFEKYFEEVDEYLKKYRQAEE